MEIKRYDMIVVGAGPAGLSAAIEAAKHGVKPIVFDENAKPGGQLFKQIHKFFGSKEHKAKIRGFQIGKELLAEAEQYGVEVVLNAAVVGLYPDREITVRVGEQLQHYKGDSVLIATGASENMVNFKGWTLPGVIGAGAAQTMMNLHHILPGKRVLMLGSGNVGLVVSFQLMQAGCDVVALCDAAPRIGGYGVHAAKVARCVISAVISDKQVWIRLSLWQCRQHAAQNTCAQFGCAAAAFTKYNFLCHRVFSFAVFSHFYHIIFAEFHQHYIVSSTRQKRCRAFLHSASHIVL